MTKQNQTLQIKEEQKAKLMSSALQSIISWHTASHRSDSEK